MDGHIACEWTEMRIRMEIINWKYRNFMRKNPTKLKKIIVTKYWKYDGNDCESIEEDYKIYLQFEQFLLAQKRTNEITFFLWCGWTDDRLMNSTVIYYGIGVDCDGQHSKLKSSWMKTTRCG